MSKMPALPTPTLAPPRNEYAVCAGAGHSSASERRLGARTGAVSDADADGRWARRDSTDVERRIRFERIVTPADWDRPYEIHHGATFNLSHSLDQMLHLRPRNRFEDLEGVYLVGGGTHPGSGLPVIFESARISARLLLSDLGVAPAACPAVAQPTLAMNLEAAR